MEVYQAHLNTQVRTHAKSLHKKMMVYKSAITDLTVTYVLYEFPN